MKNTPRIKQEELVYEKNHVESEVPAAKAEERSQLQIAVGLS